jgi:phytoene dehydrogenase-like protein
VIRDSADVVVIGAGHNGLLAAPGFGRAETPVDNVYLGSAGASPGGEVHGVCGRNAARTALARDGARGWPRRRLNRVVMSLTTR